MSRKQPKIGIVQATRAKNNFGEVIKRVYENDEPQIIERAGMPVVAIVSISDFQRLYPQHARTQPRLNRNAKRLQAAKEMARFLDEMQKGGEKFSEEEVYADVLREVMEMRRARRNR
ncbi:type II toxin-antitoxin system Phd/YefM family antitoxin [Anaerolineae bacterium CFX7]|nr:type II toxin-antitoxin system Phd/YefM family antitoxin [Anaerolineae bacterium CFX7]